MKATTMALLAVLLAFVWGMSRGVPEPVFDGQPLSVFLRNQTYGDVRIDRAAKEAIRDMGSNAVPYLVEILEARESRWRVTLRDFAQRHNLWRSSSPPLTIRQNDAALACEVLGPIAAPAAPALRRLVNDPMLAAAAIAALAQIGAENLPVLTNALQTGIDTARIHAAGHLRHLRPGEHVIPALVNALQDTNSLVRSRAAESLGTFRDHAPMVVPALVACLDDESPSVRCSAAQSLGWIGPEASAATPKLLQRYQESKDPMSGRRFAEALRAIRPEAAESSGTK